MANRINSDHQRIINNRDQLDSPAPGYLSSQSHSSKNSHTVDDVIVSLANAYENRRARQASEWERMGRQTLQLLL